MGARGNVYILVILAVTFGTVARVASDLASIYHPSKRALKDYDLNEIKRQAESHAEKNTLYDLRRATQLYGLLLYLDSGLSQDRINAYATASMQLAHLLDVSREDGEESEFIYAAARACYLQCIKLATVLRGPPKKINERKGDLDEWKTTCRENLQELNELVATSELPSLQSGRSGMEAQLCSPFFDGTMSIVVGGLTEAVPLPPGSKSLEKIAFEYRPVSYKVPPKREFDNESRVAVCIVGPGVLDHSVAGEYTRMGWEDNVFEPLRTAGGADVFLVSDDSGCDMANKFMADRIQGSLCMSAEARSRISVRAAEVLLEREPRLGELGSQSDVLSALSTLHDVHMCNTLIRRHERRRKFDYKYSLSLPSDAYFCGPLPAPAQAFQGANKLETKKMGVPVIVAHAPPKHDGTGAGVMYGPRKGAAKVMDSFLYLGGDLGQNALAPATDELPVALASLASPQLARGGAHTRNSSKVRFRRVRPLSDKKVKAHRNVLNSKLARAGTQKQSRFEASHPSALEQVEGGACAPDLIWTVQRKASPAAFGSGGGGGAAGAGEEPESGSLWSLATVLFRKNPADPTPRKAKLPRAAGRGGPFEARKAPMRSAKNVDQVFGGDLRLAEKLIRRYTARRGVRWKADVSS